MAEETILQSFNRQDFMDIFIKIMFTMNFSPVMTCFLVLLV